MNIFAQIWAAMSGQHVPIGMTYRCQACGRVHMTGGNCPEVLKARMKVMEAEQMAMWNATP